MKVPIGEWFKLPFVGKDVFIRLAREAQLKYDRERGFIATPSTKLDLLASILNNALKEEVEYSLKCFVCTGRAPCQTCIYNDVCDRRIVSPACICDDCKGKDDRYAIYSLRFAEMLE